MTMGKLAAGNIGNYLLALTGFAIRSDADMCVARQYILKSFLGGVQRI